jgi:hypothetical protein
MLSLAGLHIVRTKRDEPANGAHDLVWRHHEAQSLPAEPGGSGHFTRVLAATGPDGIATDFAFGYGERIRCRFTVSADGRRVESWAAEGVSDRDVQALFGEHILRTVLVRRGLVSFHAASLTDGDGAVLILGDKGMGKSTLSAALQQRGWWSVADDLSRVASESGAWRTFPGLRNTKLLPDSIAALGLAEQALPPRWDDLSPGLKLAGEDKKLLGSGDELSLAETAFGLRALLILRPRVGGGKLLHRAASPVAAVRSLLQHITEDPLGGETPPEFQRAIGRLVREVPVIEIALPDRLDALRSSAAEIEAIARSAGVRRAA